MKIKYSTNVISLPLLAVAMSAGTALAGTSAPAPAPTQIPDWLTIDGYVVGSYAAENYSGDFSGNNDSFFDSGANNLDSAKLGIKVTQGPFTGYASIFYVPEFDGNAFEGGSDAGILDAYMTFKSGDFSLTGGKYLSWMGYEAFDAVNMTQLTYANGFLGAIPAYHSGIKAEYVTDVFGVGVNISDSVRQGDRGFWSGDGDFSNGLGYEAYAVYKGVEKLTLWGGVAVDDTDDLENFVTYDIWASYDVSDKMTIAGEIAYCDKGYGLDGVQGLAFLKYAFTDKFSTVFRFGYDTVDTDYGYGVDAYKFTISPSYAFNEHFTLRAEVSYTEVDYNDDVSGGILFSGIQGVLKF